MTEADTTAESSEELAERIFKALGHEVNLSSPRTVATVLVDELGLPLTERNKVGIRVDSPTLEHLQSEHPHEVVELLLRWRKTRAAERRQNASGTRGSLSDAIDYDEIAEIMGVKVQTVRVYAVRDEDFPPAIAMLGRTPLRSRKAIKRYLKLREVRQGSAGGRPPRPIAGLE